MTKYFTHYSCVVIYLFNTGIYKSAFPTDSFGKLVFCLSALCQIEFDVTFTNFVTSALHNHSLCKYQVLCIFVLTYFYCVINISVQLCFKKTCFQRAFGLLSLKNSNYKKDCETFTNRKSRRRSQQKNFVKNIQEVEFLFWTFGISNML